jgi:hypothetical protein
MTNIAILATILVMMSFFGCGTTIPNRNPLGEQFPSVKGKALSGEEVRIPEHFRGNRVILVLGYKQNTQFDIDRWGIGFFTAGLDLPPVYELPTISGLLPTLFKEQINEGMRKGIPQESWKDVITIYGTDGSTVTEWTGSENPNNARVLLLDEEGKVIWFHDKGYGLPPLRSLLKVLHNE